MVLKYKNATNEKLHDKRRKKEEILANIEELEQLHDENEKVLDKYFSADSSKRALRFRANILGGYLFGALCLFLGGLPNQVAAGAMLKDFLFLTISPTLLVAFFSAHHVLNIIKLRDVTKSDYEKAIDSRKKIRDNIAKLRTRIKFLNIEISNCEKNLEDVNTPLDERNIVSFVLCGNHTDEFIKDKLLEDFQAYLDSTVDYAKISLIPPKKVDKVNIRKLKKK